ncbi:MAG: hypothetical protein SOZ86_07370, partial [Bacteroidaceae bacterium]|nr:hypothetical protein [Bacteroidaceae bacterium]
MHNSMFISSLRQTRAIALFAVILSFCPQKAFSTTDSLRYITPQEKDQGQFLWYGNSPKGYPRRIP